MAEVVTVGVFGAGGRMGQAVCSAVDADPGLRLVAAVDPGAAGQVLSPAGGRTDEVAVVASAEELTEKPSVMVDFTHLEAARQNLAWCAAHGVHAVVGTTGFSEDDLASIRAAFTTSNCLIAPNFAIGAVLMMRFAELAAPHFETAEVIEFHHDAKLDAPSGTALRTVERMAAAKGSWPADPTATHVVAGSRGGEGPGGIRVHSVRMRGVVANQEVILGTTGQTLTIRHDTTDRTSFMPGVVLAVKRIAEQAGLTIGLDPLLDL